MLTSRTGILASRHVGDDDDYDDYDDVDLGCCFRMISYLCIDVQMLQPLLTYLSSAAYRHVGYWQLPAYLALHDDLFVCA